ncbi:hypothetical protein P799_01340 [Lysinibacillus sphaericus CBAM5]|uniref:Uncharacterized protein n=1 Tax=Lysinibacillus sphaericus CBAM5 TaxID=1400869 RepID=W7RU76_LYSSH|nr:hypothetical protein P799_01340 [Lysinibacillus sphaericus CBAM5]
MKLNLQYPFLEAIRDEKEGEETDPAFLKG